MNRTRRTVGRTTTLVARTAALLTAASLLLAGCMIEDFRGLTITVTNHTDQIMAIRVGDAFPSRVSVDEVKRADLGGAPTDCLVDGGVTATSEDGARVAQIPGPICDGDAWVIEQSDLEPAELTSPVPGS